MNCSKCGLPVEANSFTREAGMGCMERGCHIPSCDAALRLALEKAQEQIQERDARLAACEEERQALDAALSLLSQSHARVVRRLEGRLAAEVHNTAQLAEQVNLLQVGAEDDAAEAASLYASRERTARKMRELRGKCRELKAANQRLLSGRILDGISALQELQADNERLKRDTAALIAGKFVEVTPAPLNDYSYQQVASVFHVPSYLLEENAPVLPRD